MRWGGNDNVFLPLLFLASWVFGVSRDGMCTIWVDGRLCIYSVQARRGLLFLFRMFSTAGGDCMGWERKGKNLHDENRGDG